MSFYGITGRLKALIDLFPTDNKTKINRLTKSLDLIATSAEVAQSSIWDATLAAQISGNLDQKISEAGIVYKFQLFDTVGAATWTRPTSHAGNTVLVTGIGGGGGGCDGSNHVSGSYVNTGGNGGDYVVRLPHTVSGNMSLTIGAAGAAASSSYADGGNGGDTVYDSYTLQGGRGGLHGGEASYDMPNLVSRTQAHGGWIIDGVLTMHAQSVPGVFGGRGGLSVWPLTISSGGQFGDQLLGGGGGLLLDRNAPVNDACSGAGYGAGGASAVYSNAATLPKAGQAGAILVEWWEHL